MHGLVIESGGDFRLQVIKANIAIIANFGILKELVE